MSGFSGANRRAKTFVLSSDFIVTSAGIQQIPGSLVNLDAKTYFLRGIFIVSAASGGSGNIYQTGTASINSLGKVHIETYQTATGERINNTGFVEIVDTEQLTSPSVSPGQFIKIEGIVKADAPGSFYFGATTDNAPTSFIVQAQSWFELIEK